MSFMRTLRMFNRDVRIGGHTGSITTSSMSDHAAQVGVHCGSGMHGISQYMTADEADAMADALKAAAAHYRDEVSKLT